MRRRLPIASGRADSVSGWVNQALVEHLANERRLAALSKLLAEYEADYGELTPEELAVREREDRRMALVVRGAARAGVRKRRRPRAA